MNWSFNEEVSKQFDVYVRNHVPMYDEIHNLISDLSRWFVQENTLVCDIGTSTGEAIKNIRDKNKERNASYIGFDTSESMVDIASQRFANYKDVSILNKDVNEYQFENVSLVTSVLTIQFIDIQERQNLINKIYEGLNIGGAFIFVEKVFGENYLFENMWNQLYHDLKLRNNVSEKEVIDKSISIRGVLKPLTMSKNITLLTQAGFTDIDIFFKWNNFVGFVAVKEV